MFNLEQSISDWRAQMLAGGISSDATDELEIHLRDHITSLQSGLPEQAAFQTAVSLLGNRKSLKKEFSKAGSRRLKFHWDNPWPLHVLSIFYAYWGIRAILFIVMHGCYLRFSMVDLYLWTFVLNIGVALGLLFRQNAWRLYALISTGIGCYFPIRDLVWWFLAPASEIHWSPRGEIFFAANFALNVWALYILNRPSVSALFRPKRKTRTAA